ncbi:hypothetical protein NMG60_11023549 [Bertholletia excelsa]
MESSNGDVHEHDHDHPWSLCLDTGFNLLPVPDIPQEKPGELPDLIFEDTGFVDNIDFIFDGPISSDKFEFDPDTLFSTAFGFAVDDSSLVGNKEIDDQQRSNSPLPPPSSSSSSPSSSSASTTTMVT